jgi:phosphate starvation-inducible PhoH-like protein
MGDAVTLKDIGDVILHNKAYPGSAPPSTNWHKLDFNDGDRIHTIQPKTEHQKQLIDGVIGRQIIFANGEAGVGKTFLACAIALKFLEKRMIKKIVITRPAITSEDFGFLPGDIDEKMSPFLLPINSIFEELIGKEKRDKYIETGAIEILPIAYARGITLGNFEGVITIVDESENVELKNFYLMLTRLGDHPNSKIIFCGDSRQSDLSFNKKNSLDTVAEILKDSPYTSIVTFDKSDVVRSAVVKDIVARFEKYDDEKKKTK